MKELERGECRLVQVHVDVHQREPPILESRKTIRDPTPMELALWKRLQLVSRDPLVRFEVAGLPSVTSCADFGVVVGRLRKTFERIAQMMRPGRIVQAVQNEIRTLAVSHTALRGITLDAARGNAVRDREQQLATVERQSRQVAPLRFEFGQTTWLRPREVMRIDEQAMPLRDARQVFRPGAAPLVQRPYIPVEEIAQRHAGSPLGTTRDYASGAVGNRLRADRANGSRIGANEQASNAIDDLIEIDIDAAAGARERFTEAHRESLLEQQRVDL